MRSCEGEYDGAKFQAGVVRETKDQIRIQIKSVLFIGTAHPSGYLACFTITKGEYPKSEYGTDGTTDRVDLDIFLLDKEIPDTNPKRFVRLKDSQVSTLHCIAIREIAKVAMNKLESEGKLSKVWNKTWISGHWRGKHND